MNIEFTENCTIYKVLAKPRISVTPNSKISNANECRLSRIMFEPSVQSSPRDCENYDLWGLIRNEHWIYQKLGNFYQVWSSLEYQ